MVCMHSSAIAMILTLFSSCFVVAAGVEVGRVINTLGGSSCLGRTTSDCSDAECVVLSGACACKYEAYATYVCYGGKSSNIWYATGTALQNNVYTAPSSAAMVTASPGSECWHDYSDQHGGVGGTYKKYDCTGKADGEVPVYRRYTDAQCQTVDDTITVSLQIRCVSEGSGPSKIGGNGVISLCMWDGCSAPYCNTNQQTCVEGRFEESSVKPCKYSSNVCSCDTTVSQYRKLACVGGAMKHLYFATATTCSTNQQPVETLDVQSDWSDCNENGHTWTVSGTQYQGKFRRTSCTGVPDYGKPKWLHYVTQASTCPPESTTPDLTRNATDSSYIEECVCVEKYMAPTPAPPISGAPATYRATNYASTDTQCSGTPLDTQNLVADNTCMPRRYFDPTAGKLKTDSTKWNRLSLSCETAGSQAGSYKFNYQEFTDAACTQIDSTHTGDMVNETCEEKDIDGVKYRQTIDILCTGSGLIDASFRATAHAALLIACVIGALFF